MDVADAILHVIPIRRLSIPYKAAGDREGHPAAMTTAKMEKQLSGGYGCTGSLILPSRTFSHEYPLLFHFRSPDMLEHLSEVFEFLADMYFSFFRSTIQFGFS
jgi:hypothetical protein